MRQIASSVLHAATTKALITDDGTDPQVRARAACTQLLLTEQSIRTASPHLAAAHQAIARLGTSGAPTA